MTARNPARVTDSHANTASAMKMGTNLRPAPGSIICLGHCNQSSVGGNVFRGFSTPRAKSYKPDAPAKALPRGSLVACQAYGMGELVVARGEPSLARLARQACM